MRIFLLLAWFVLQSQIGFTQNKEKEKPYVVMVSLDGFRHDYVQRYQPPFLSKLIKEGTSAKSMIPIYPSKTFPNHYSIITGMHADKHGILDNPFYDSQIDAVYNSGNREVSMQPVWYQGTPLWQLAQENKIKTAAFFWIGSELPIKGQYPTYYKKYDGKIANETRVQQVFDWLNLPEEERPRLITVYFSLVDDAGHRYGPDSPEMQKIVLKADSLVGKLQEGLKKITLPTNLFIVSDHGMEQIPDKPENFINIEKIVDLRDTTINFLSNAVHVHLYFKDKSKTEKIYQEFKSKAKNFTPYLKKDIPKKWRYTSATRTGDILVVANPPYLIGGNVAEKKREKEQTRGQHGYDPYVYPNMHAIFYAWGKDIKENFTIPSFDCVHIYPFIAHLLGIKPPKDIDGKLKVLQKIQKKK
jgi:predicted AlkP superfamily pyrophosphatase or phosphodiesterase